LLLHSAPWGWTGTSDLRATDTDSWLGQSPVARSPQQPAARYESSMFYEL
jgi:hypothetical protein